MDERTYEGLITRYARVLECAASAIAAAAAALAALPPSLPTGKPTNAEFPSAASTPPVNIMTPEPPTAAAPAATAGCDATAPVPAPRPPARPRPRSSRLHRRRTGGSSAGPACAGPPVRHRCRTCATTTDGFQKPMPKLTSHHAASSHQACRRLRVRQGTQGLGRRTHEDGEAERACRVITSTSPG